MLGYAIAATVLGIIISSVGLGICVGCVASASRRSQPVRNRFWALPETFEPVEFANSRRGLWLCALGIAVLCIPLYLLA